MNKNKKLKSYIINFIAIIILFVIVNVLMNAGVINKYYRGIIMLVCINIILATSLNLTTGFLGQLALGHAGFMSVGAYAAAIFVKSVQMPDMLKFIVSLIVGGLVAAIFGMIVGIPALRLKGDYLAIITLGFGEIIRVIIENLSITGGAQGLRSIPKLSSVNSVLVITILIVMLLYTLIRSRHGRAIMAIREDEIAADASGIPTTFYKIFAFAFAAFLAGVAGGIYAQYLGILGAKTFGFMRSIEIIVMVVLGGMGSFTGSILSATVLTYLPEALRSFSEYRMLIYSLALILIMIFRPKGIMGRYEFSLTRAIDKLIKLIKRFIAFLRKDTAAKSDSKGDSAK